MAGTDRRATDRGRRRLRPGPSGLGLGALALLGGLAACMPGAGGPGAGGPGSEGPGGPEVSGRALYAENCAVCHGDGGRGDGPAAAGLTPPPTDLTRLAAENGGVFPMVRVMSYVDGYTRADGSMPEFGLLLEGQRVLVDTGDGILTPTPLPLVELAEYLRGMQR